MKIIMFVVVAIWVLNFAHTIITQESTVLAQAMAQGLVAFLFAGYALQDDK